jgi:hypothetical protein
VEDRNHFDVAVAYSIDDDIRRTDDDQLACTPDATGPTHLGIVAELLGMHSDLLHDPVGRARIVTCNVVTDFFEVP